MAKSQHYLLLEEYLIFRKNLRMSGNYLGLTRCKKMTEDILRGVALGARRFD